MISSRPSLASRADRRLQHVAGRLHQGITVTRSCSQALSAGASCEVTPVLEVRRLSARYGRVEALHDISLTVADGEFCGPCWAQWR